MTDFNEGHRQRLRERFFNTGLDGLLQHEVLELILFTCCPRKDTKELAKKILSHFDNNLNKVFHAEKQDFQGLEISDQTIALLKLMRETNIYIQKMQLIKQKKIGSTKDVFEFLKFYYKGLHKEEFYVIYLNTRNHILWMGSEFKGSIDETKIYVREIIKNCLRHNAAAVILSHNHPSGVLEPSTTDINMTIKIQNALKLIDIKLIDHLIVSDNDFYSFVEYGIIN